jgi:sirohydrochlorin cobaltochelatase
MLILLAHGSRDPEWRASLEALAEAAASRLAPEPVQLAFMQFTGPTLPEVVEEGLRQGARRFRLLPLFMARAGHVDKDIRPLVESLARIHPEATLDLMTPVGEDPHFAGLIAQIANAAPFGGLPNPTTP